MRNVTVHLVTKRVDRTELPPDSDPNSAFMFALMRRGSTEPLFSAKSPPPSYTFPNVPAGDYTANVSRFGFEASADFTVEETEDDAVDVPDTVTVTVVNQPAAQP